MSAWRCSLVGRRPGLVRLALAVCLGASACTWVSAAEHAERLRYLDMDGDGFDDVALGGDDCDDSDPAVHPGAEETCERPGDDDCNGLADGADPKATDLVTLYQDSDGDGFGDEDVKALGCAGKDPGTTEPGDCDDDNPDANPNQEETCATAFDDDCDGLINADDESAIGAEMYYPDFDRDGYGNNEVPGEYRCDDDNGELVDNNTDCKDDDPTTYPDAEMECPDGFSEVTDCKGPPKFCTLPAMRGTPMFSGQPIDDLVTGGGYVVARSGEEVAVWKDAALPLAWPGSEWLLVVEPEQAKRVVRLAAGPSGALIGDPNADAGAGLFHCVSERDGNAMIATFATEKRNQTIGSGVAWLPSAGDTDWPGVIYGTGGGRSELAWVAEGASILTHGATLPSNASSLDAGTWLGEIAWLAAGSEQDSNGAGKVQLSTGDSVYDPAVTWSATGSAGEGIGKRVLTLLIDEGGEPGLVATTAGGVRIWINPAAGGTEVRDITFGGQPESLATGDFDGDGRADLAVGIPLGAGGKGEVYLFLGGNIEQDAERLLVVGDTFGQRLGSAVAIEETFVREGEDINRDGGDELIIASAGDVGTPSLVFVPGSNKWSLPSE